MHKILLIEDDESFGYILKEYLHLHDFQVTWAKTGEEGLNNARKNKYDLGIFDIMLPEKNGYEVATDFRKIYPDLPFIFLSAKSLKIDKLKGYKLGADDYITKPVDEELLLAKIKVLLFRSSNNLVYQQNYQIGKFKFTYEMQQLEGFGEVKHLTKREAELLQMLCHNMGQLTPRNKALREIWESNDEFSKNSMDVFISHLRKYLSKDESIQIRNVHGKGFVLEVGK